MNVNRSSGQAGTAVIAPLMADRQRVRNAPAAGNTDDRGARKPKTGGGPSGL